MFASSEHISLISCSNSDKLFYLGWHFFINNILAHSLKDSPKYSSFSCYGINLLKHNNYDDCTSATTQTTTEHPFYLLRDLRSPSRWAVPACILVMGIFKCKMSRIFDSQLFSRNRLSIRILALGFTTQLFSECF